jgi:hypothetical protein
LRRITYCTAPTTEPGPSNAIATAADEDKAGPSNAIATADEDKAGPSNAIAAADEDKAGPSNAIATAADEDVNSTGTSEPDDQHDEWSMSDVSVSDEGKQGILGGNKII